MAKFDPDVVLEFYANAWPTEEGVQDMRSWSKLPEAQRWQIVRYVQSLGAKDGFKAEEKP